MKLTARSRLETYASLSRTQSDEETYGLLERVANHAGDSAWRGERAGTNGAWRPDVADVEHAARERGVEMSDPTDVIERAQAWLAAADERGINRTDKNGYLAVIEDLVAEVEFQRTALQGYRNRQIELTDLLLVHGNIMGRIAANLFGRQNNVTDEECVDETAAIGYRMAGLYQRLAQVQEERNALNTELRARQRLENDLMESLNALGKIVTMADRAIGCSPSEQDDYLADISDTARKVAMRERASPVGEVTNRPSTCHPDDNPPVPCPKKYALSECKAAALGGEGKDG